MVFCQPDASEDEIKSVEEAIHKLDNVDTVTHSTKSEQLKTLKEEDPDLYGDITDEENPSSNRNDTLANSLIFLPILND